MSTRPIAYVMEQTLGNVTHYLNLRRHGEGAGDLLRWLPIEYRAGRLPWTVAGSLLARRALNGVVDEIDGIFMHTTTLSPLSVNHFRRKPTVLSTDGTPLNKRHMRDAYGLKPQGRFSEQAKRMLYRRIFATTAGCVAWSNWTKQSFVEDYGVKAEDVAVIPPGIDLTQFSVAQRDNEVPRILFVGGDFVRKGGDLLLQVFRARFRGRAELVLVTRDAVADEPGVRVHRNVQANSDELRALYRTSDVFALPTRADCHSLVCMEALATGMPIVATRVGGIPDMIHEGKTGYGIAVDDADALGDRLEALLTKPELRQAMSASCRAEAERHFDAQKNAARLFEFVRSRVT